MTLIQDWKNRRQQQKKTHKKVVRRLRQHKGKRLNEFGAKVHEEVFAKVDCLECANCCTSIPPMVNKTDAARIAKLLGMKVSAFEEQYVTIDEDGDRVMNTTPCPFLLENNHCTIYEHRPRACREYPLTDDFQFAHNLNQHAVNAQYCPGVFHILERMNQRIP
jgi:Fe-S-cluster containining protein